MNTQLLSIRLLTFILSMEEWEAHHKIIESAAWICLPKIKMRIQWIARYASTDSKVSKRDVDYYICMTAVITGCQE